MEDSASGDAVLVPARGAFINARAGFEMVGAIRTTLTDETIRPFELREGLDTGHFIRILTNEIHDAQLVPHELFADIIT